MFDDADIQQCYRRSESIIPQQALALANSRVSLEMAVHWRAGWTPTAHYRENNSLKQRSFPCFHEHLTTWNSRHASLRFRNLTASTTRTKGGPGERSCTLCSITTTL